MRAQVICIALIGFNSQILKAHIYNAETKLGPDTTELSHHEMRNITIARLWALFPSQNNQAHSVD